METILIDRFLSNKFNQDALEKSSQKNYRIDLNCFYKYISEKLNVASEVEMIKKVQVYDVEEYRDALLYEKNMAVNTVNRRIASLKQFAEYVMTRNIRETNFMLGLKRVKQNEKNENIKQIKVKDIITKRDMRRLIETAGTREPDQRCFEFNSARNLFMLSILASTGMRIEELNDLKWHMLEEKKGYYMINIDKNITKCGYARRVPVCGEAYEYFVKYLQKIEEANIESEYIMSSQNGKKMNTSGNNDILSKLCKRAGIRKNITNHCFRAFFATTATEINTNKALINIIGGWTDSKDMVQKHYLKDSKELDGIKVKVCKSIQERVFNRI